MQRERESVCCEAQGRNRSAVLLADFLFPAVQHCIVALPHTHSYSFSRPCASFFFLCCSFAVPSFSPTWSQINLFPLFLGTLIPHHTATVRYILSFFRLTILPHGNLTPVRTLAEAYFCIYDSRVVGVVGCLH